jgi:ABC-type phosphate transport system ATPase subunit
MSDRIQSAVVVFDREYRTDDAEAILAALRMVKGVAAVQPGPIMDHEAYQARVHVRTNMGQALRSLIWEAQEDSPIWREIRDKLEELRKKRGY